MACWVVPQVAAEIWGCHIDRIWNAIRDGALKTMQENGWMFVDVAPTSPTMQTGTARWAGSPWTQDVVSAAEIAALHEPVEEADVVQEVVAEEDESDSLVLIAAAEEQMEYEEQSDEVETSEEEVTEDADVLADFRKIRQQVARTRRAPLAQAA